MRFPNSEFYLRNVSVVNIKTIIKNMSSSACENSLDPIFLQNQLATARKEIHNLRQQLITLNHVHRKECDLIYKKLEEWRCPSCMKKQEHQHPTGSSTSVVANGDFHCKYIGMVNTFFPEKRGTPRQPGICNDMIAKLTLFNSVFTNPNHALEGLQEYSHMWILFHFHKNESTHIRAKVSPPRLNGIRTGVFATRSPHRPCPIGLSLVKIDRINENVIYFSGVDMVDQTPVLDIKPYIPQYDNPTLTNIYYPADNATRNGVAQHGTELSSFSRDSLMGSTIERANSAEIVDSLESLNIRVMDGEENGHRDIVLGSPSTETVLSVAEESFYSRSSSRMGEREAPDGEEEETPRTVQISTPTPVSTPPEAAVRVPSWIDQAPVPRLTVLYKDRALAQIVQLGTEGEEKKSTITSVLREDPRSVYLRERWGSHCYVFRIADLYVSCKFNDSNQSVTVYQVFQNETPSENGE